MDGRQGGFTGPGCGGRRSGSKGNVPPTNKCIRERVCRVLRSLSSPRDRLRKGVDPKQTAGSSGLGVVGSAWREGGGCARSGFEEDWELGRDGAGEAWEGGNGDTGKPAPALAPAPQSEGGRGPFGLKDGLQLRRVPRQRQGRCRAGVRDGEIGNKSSTEGAIPSNVSVPETRRRPGQGGKPSAIQSRVAERLGSGEVAPPEEAGMNDQRWSSLQGREDEWEARPWR